MKKMFVLLAILLVAGFLRFYNILESPGYEWDEPVYAQIAERTVLIGYPNDGNISSPVPYLYHPPFDFYLKGVWFTLVGASGPFEDITAGRILSGIESLISLIIAYFCMLEIAGKKGAVIGLLLLATDGWLIYTSRLNLIENAMMPLGMFGVWMYVRATKSKKTIYYLLAGCFLAFAVVYKHTGIPFLMVPIINLVITHQDWKNHLLLIETIYIVVLTYLAGMLLVWKGDYIFQTWVQIERAVGVFHSRGLNFNIGVIIKAIVQTYWVFGVTIALVSIVGLAMLYRLIKVIRGNIPFNSVLLSWTIAAFVFLTVISLKAPHYLITVLIPAYMFIASELGNPDIRKKPIKRIIVGIVCFALVANLVTWVIRFVVPHDNALLETYNYFKTVPVTAHVLDDDCVSSGIRQVSYNLDRTSSYQAIADAELDYVVIYTTITQKLPMSQALNDLLAQSTVVKRFQGFKELIQIYQVNSP